MKLVKITQVCKVYNAELPQFKAYAGVFCKHTALVQVQRLLHLNMTVTSTFTYASLLWELWIKFDGYWVRESKVTLLFQETS